MTNTDFKGKLALVTGSTGGIGQATCRKLAEIGLNIAVHYNSATGKAAELVKELEGMGVKAQAYKADMSDYESVRRPCSSSEPRRLQVFKPRLTNPRHQVRKLHASVTSTLGHPTVLFANAGTTLGQSGIQSATAITIETFESTWRTNCGSAFLLTQLCLPFMESESLGRVIFCSSVAGFTGGVVGPHYASSKSALHGLVHWLSMWYAPKGISVNAVAPALIEGTGMLPGDEAGLSKS